MENLPAQFSRQTIRLQFPKDVHWGDDITVWISKIGDLAHSMYLRVTWPADAPTTVQPSAGTAMIDRIELSYKDQLIERIYGENLYMLGDIKVPQAKQSALSNLVGTGTTTALSSYHIPLPFLILKKGIPLISLREAPKFRVVFNPSSIFTTSIYTKTIQVDLLVDYVYLSQPERDWFVEHELVYLTHAFQRLQFKIPTSTAETIYTYYTDFVNDVKELFWVIQSDAASNVYDYGNHLVNLQLTFNNQDFVTKDYATAQYLHVLQPLQYHTRVPTGNYYMYSFALQPESDQPTGEMNMSAITRQQHSLTLSASPSSTRNVRIYAHSYNLFRIKDGDGVTVKPLREGGTTQMSMTTGSSGTISNVFDYIITHSSGVYTPPVSGGLPPVPDVVTGFTASDPTLSTVDLAWTPASYASSYSIVSSPSTTTQTTSGTSLTFTGLAPATEYTFTITPSNVSGNGPTTTSDPISTNSAPPGPDAVTGFTGTSTTISINLTWDSALDATSYLIVSDPPTTTRTTSDTFISFTDADGIVYGTGYTFTITPSNVFGDGPSTQSGIIYLMNAEQLLSYTGTIETLTIYPGAYLFEMAGGSGPGYLYYGNWGSGAYSTFTTMYTIADPITIQYAIGQASPGGIGGAGGTYVYDMTNFQWLFVAGGAGYSGASFNSGDGYGGTPGFGGGSGAGVYTNGSDSLEGFGSGGFTVENGAAGGAGYFDYGGYNGGFGGGGGGGYGPSSARYVGGGGGYTGGSTFSESDSIWFSLPGTSYLHPAAIQVSGNATNNGPTRNGYINISPAPVPDTVPLLAPSNPTSSTVDLSWTAALYATSYSIVSSPPTVTFTVVTNIYYETLTFTGLAPGTTYTFIITPSNMSGNGLATTSEPISTL